MAQCLPQKPVRHEFGTKNQQKTLNMVVFACSLNTEKSGGFFGTVANH